jgi:hypothetical protein
MGSVMGTLGGLLLVGSGCLLVINNPGPVDYETYATDSLSSYLKQEVCPQTPVEFGGFVQSYCKTLVDSGQPQIKKIIAQTTHQRNFFLFSVYQTTLTLPAPLPTYEFQTIGVMRQFYTYQAEQL